ncbi:MAG: 2-oxoacid:ferredoxin oxidoreductase subunit beta [Desulfohalobiaceae bacterium]
MGVQDYIRSRFFPHIWCAGCGHGTVLNSLLHAVEELGLAKRDMVMVSGIGCSSRISGYVDFHSLHTLHGRALAFATGIKMSKPELTVLAPMGDGDALAIGGNHFIHACRRNIDMTAIVMNNRIYGMTGGQYSPLSGTGVLASTAPQKTIDPAFDVVSLALAAGASFVARGTSYHVLELQKLLQESIQHPGFSVLEVLSPCPTQFGRKNRQGDAAEMLEWLKENTTKQGSKAKQDNPELIERGIFIQEQRPEYCEQYQNLVDQAQEG